MNNEVLVKVEGLSKKFSKDLKTGLWYGVQDLFSGLTGNTKERSLRPKEFWAVKDVSFELRRGECLGLIGHNGAGKSTLLKILNGLINPDAGKVTIKGRVGALIELGAGFNPILTGKENIYNNGAVLGFTKKEIDSKLEEIIAFAELEEFIDMPVQHYSSGMKVRLGFAVAAQMEPDVLIIDEVLAVGDVGFRIKCYNAIISLLKNTAIIFVSHSMPQVSKICTKIILLNKGGVQKYSEDLSSVISNYFLDSEVENKVNITGNGKVEILDKKDLTDISLQKGESLDMRCKFQADSSIKQVAIRFVIYDKEFKGLIEFDSLNEGVVFKNDNKEISFNVSFKNKLNFGNYNVTMIITEITNDNLIGERLLRYEGFATFRSIDSKENFESYIPLTIKSIWK